MRYYSDDDLERILASLPLEEAPENLRASILAATVYRQPLPVKAWEVGVIGVCLAVITWLLVLIAQGGTSSIVGTLNIIGGAILATLSQPATLLWIAIGSSAAMWLTLLTPAKRSPQKAARR